MRIRSIRVENVRRFVRPVVVEGIGPGLNLLCEPNESGKSTLFDALQALFFAPHRSKAQGIQSLRPHAGGAPEVSVEIEVEDGRHRIAKRWLSAPRAEVHREGRLIAQADEAEAWIAARVAPAGEAGPAGLLWVRQGETGLDGGTPRERDEARGARRGLVSSVAGEVEAMTGGRRMDALRRRCRDEIGLHLTPTGKPKVGGPLRAAQEAVEAWEARREDLASKVGALRGDLDRRRVVRRELAELEDPEAARARRAKLREKEAALDAATRHAEERERAARDERTARALLDGALARREAQRAAQRERSEAIHAAEEALTRTAEAKAASARAQVRRDAAEARAGEAEGAWSAADRTRRAAQAAEARAAAEARRAELAARLDRAEAARARAEAARAGVSLGPDAATMQRLEALDRDLAVARAARDRAAPSLTMDYADGASRGVSRDGAALPDGVPVPIPEGAALDLAGLGRLTIRSGRAAEAEAVRDAEARLRHALDAAGLADLDAAREAAAHRAAEEAEEARARAMLHAVAPEGLDALREALAALPPPAEPDPSLPAAGEAQRLADEAGAAREAARRAADEARGRTEAAARALDREVLASRAAEDRLARASAALPADPEAAEAGMAREIDVLGADLAAAEDRLRALCASAPDLEAARAAATRARAVVAEAEARRQAHAIELTGLDHTIAARADDAVEEELADAEARLEAARAALAALEREVQVLRRLDAALDEARAQARERYLAPVLTELRPLLRLIWPDAELRLDDEAVLPSALLRDGAEEAFDVLSGGTQEQIAMMVRLAFARMLAAGGRHAPVILDDALIFTDDERIERMFDALHRQADDLQVIVLSCRQRAFRDLGGAALRIVPAAEPVGAA